MYQLIWKTSIPKLSFLFFSRNLQNVYKFIANENSILNMYRLNKRKNKIFAPPMHELNGVGNGVGWKKIRRPNIEYGGGGVIFYVVGMWNPHASCHPWCAMDSFSMWSYLLQRNLWKKKKGLDRSMEDDNTKKRTHTQMIRQMRPEYIYWIQNSTFGLFLKFVLR